MVLQTPLGNLGEKVELLRNIVEIIGLPAIAAIALKLHGLQTAALKAENSLLKLTQYDQAEKILQAQKSVFEAERQGLRTKIEELENSKLRSEAEVSALKERYYEVTRQIEDLNARTLESEETRDFRHSVFQESLSFGASSFGQQVDFADSRFEKLASFSKVDFADVSFQGTRFRSKVDLSEAKFLGGISMNRTDLRHATFHQADLRGADLSTARIDPETKLPTEQRPFEMPKL